MELIELPGEMRNRGFQGWPSVYRVSSQEEPPPPGIPYIRAEKTDFPLVFRLMVPKLMVQHPYLNWSEVYRSLTGKKYSPLRVYRQRTEGEGLDIDGSVYGASSTGTEMVSLEELAADDASYVDLDMLSKMSMIPTFIEDIREAIRINVTDNYQWTDGYNKKTGVCSGYLVEQPKARSLVILDVSYSIPDGVSAGMLTLIKTISEIVHADVIITGGKSFFYTCEEVRNIDIHEERRRIPRANEMVMFLDILQSHNMDYENVIAFGDSDWPGTLLLNQKINTKRFYSFFVSSIDQYGISYKSGAGYGRWVIENNPNVEVIHNTDWAKFFTKESRQTW